MRLGLKPETLYKAIPRAWSWERQRGGYRLLKGTSLALGIKRTYTAGPSCGILQHYLHQDAGPLVILPIPNGTVWKEVLSEFSTFRRVFSLSSSLLLLLYLLRMGEEGLGVGPKYKREQAKAGKHNTAVYPHPGICQGTDRLITCPQLSR